MTDNSCPYLNCGVSLALSGRSPLIQCKGCNAAVLLCPACGLGNRVWSAFCRACGTEISDRKGLIEQSSMQFPDKWEKSRGLFLSKTIERSAEPGWRGKLSGIDGSILVFGGISDYSNLFLIHPHFDMDPLPLHDFLSEGGDANLSGASVITDRHLFLGSKDRLFQIDLASISSPQPYRIDMHLRDFEAGCEVMSFLSQDLLLLGERLDADDIRFTIWDIPNQVPAADQLETRARFFSVANGRLFAASDEGVMIFSIDSDRKRIEPTGNTLRLNGAVPLSKPLFIGGRLYLIASRDREKLEGSLLKWVIDGEGGIDEEPRFLHSGRYYGISALSINYALLTVSGVSVYDATLDREQHRFPQQFGMYPPAGARTFGPLIALPFMNSPVSISVAVVNGVSGQYVFTTDPFRQVLSEPVLWSRFLFVLGRQTKEEPAGVYVHDLTGERSEGAPTGI
jgi:hypothetical protein